MAEDSWRAAEKSYDPRQRADLMRSEKSGGDEQRIQNEGTRVFLSLSLSLSHSLPR